MCGIACIIDKSQSLDENVLTRFTNCIGHRGPDSVGFAKFANSEGLPESGQGKFLVGLGHRRLSIIDLSEAGSQPMFSTDKNSVLVFNGEIYNYIELKQELVKEGVSFKSHTDSEVIIEAYRKWGKECLSKFNGMWSFALLDRKKRKIFISRDRIGVKPLYYTRSAGILAIASEIKQFFELPGFKKEPNIDACLSYLVTGYEMPPETFFKDVMSFPPGCCAEIDLDSPEVKPEEFWTAEKISVREYSEDEIIDLIGKTFSASVNFRLRSDVPVGGCLSGGLDSSAIFVEMKHLQQSQTFNAFSACFDDPRIDERKFMKSIVDKTGSRHIEVFPNADEFISDLPAFLRQHDEPVGSVSMYAQYKIMQAARREKIPVLLDGQGGDELFSGYWPAYFLMLKYFYGSKNIFSIFKHSAGTLFGGNTELLSQAYSHLSEYRKRNTRVLPFSISKKYHEHLAEIKTLNWHREAQDLSPCEYRKAEIFKIHLPRLLKWEDRNSMAFSIESRVPFLDVNMVELLLSVNPELNMRKGWTKFLLRKSMDSKLPSEICWRKDKKGFETPQEKWMKSGSFNKYLISWASEKNHPVSELIADDFQEIQMKIIDGRFDATRMFRLFCLDYWMKHIVGN
ncbi:MAG TPA: asparagine synthase (glutamine-hydrolyzing) [Lentisphaeria bacterium]|nr:MAG: asparagine synthase (glutamine-hydrolyzing) [Lentisphaerae bacterium GWF2_50_93]HCE45598.1 asparagine synthase (glutamine-hydrolyzing) [Lentisphaeria bacterium]